MKKAYPLRGEEGSKGKEIKIVLSLLLEEEKSGSQSPENKIALLLLLEEEKSKR